MLVDKCGLRISEFWPKLTFLLELQMKVVLIYPQFITGQHTHGWNAYSVHKFLIFHRIQSTGILNSDYTLEIKHHKKLLRIHKFDSMAIFSRALEHWRRRGLIKSKLQMKIKALP